MIGIFISLGTRQTVGATIALPVCYFTIEGIGLKTVALKAVLPLPTEESEHYPKMREVVAESMEIIGRHAPPLSN